MNLNKVFLIGNLTRDPELRTIPSGQPVASFGLATNRIFNDRAGQRQKQVEFHNIVLWGRLAEIANQYLSKGKMLFVEGRIQTRNWDGPDGTKRYRTEVIGERIQLGPRFGSNPASGAAPSGEPEVMEATAKEEEIPTIQQDEPPKEEIPF